MRSNRGPVTIGLAAVAVASMLSACGGDDDPTADVTTTTRAEATTTTATESEPERLFGSFDVGGRELSITCLGTGSPTVIMEPGEGQDHTQFGAIQRTLSERTRACT